MSQSAKLTQADRIVYDFQRTGQMDGVFSKVCRSLGALTRENDISRFKIGKTNDPLGRYKREYGREYAELVVLYRTRSRASAAEMEKRLIDRNCEFHRCKNWAVGGGGHVGKRGPYYVYVVVRFRKKTTNQSREQNIGRRAMGLVEDFAQALFGGTRQGGPGGTQNAA